MPNHPGKQCNGCKGRYTGRYCPACSNGWATRKPRSWARGSTPEWREFRAAWLAEHPVCMEFSSSVDCLGVATVVCHRPGIDYARDRCNPAAIEGQRCAVCDARETARQGHAAQRGDAPT